MTMVLTPLPPTQNPVTGYESVAENNGLIFPDADGEPMSDNTLQFQWIVTIKEGLETLFATDPNVFVAGDLLWYPTETNNRIRAAPDVMVAFGRPKGYRGSYKQWREGGVAPQVVFEILSPGNRNGEMSQKAIFYDRWGVEEYYVYNPETWAFSALVRSVITGALEDVPLPDSGYISPRLQVRFHLSGDGLVIYRPDGEPLKTHTELFVERDAANAARDAANAARDAERAAKDRLAAKLRELGIDPDAV